MIAFGRRSAPSIRLRRGGNYSGRTEVGGALSGAAAELGRLPGLLRSAAAAGFAPSRLNVVHWASWAVTLSILLGTTAVVLDGRVFGWEQEVSRWVQGREYPAWLFDVTSNRVTGEWEGGLVVALAALSLLVLRQRLDAALVLLTFPLHVLGNFPKAIVDRERPSDAFEGIVGLGGERSFTSGHAEFAFTFFGLLAFIALTHVRPWPGRVAIVGAWLVFAFPVGYDRIATGTHWPLDVLIGYIVGIGLLSGLIWLRRALVSATEAKHGDGGDEGDGNAGWSGEPALVPVATPASGYAGPSIRAPAGALLGTSGDGG